MRMVDLINKKKQKQELTKEEIHYLINGKLYLTSTFYCPRRTGVTFAQSSTKVTKSALYL